MRAQSGSKNIIGERLASARSAHEPPLTQDALSGRLAKIGLPLDRAAIAKIETGRRYVLDFELKAFAKALGVSASWLLGAKQ